MRGEHLCNTVDAVLGTESSPHTRGAPERDPGSAQPAGIIPACAGSTRRHRAWHRALRDHPRMRGEHQNLGQAFDSLAGSSPHARGAQRLERIACLVPGIIPACAGSTRGCATGRWSSRDHPRMRGEHCFAVSASMLVSESSPHARGALSNVISNVVAWGIIPACAGSTTCRPRARPPSRDHPRMRGEHSQLSSFLSSFVGSSPHARGAHPKESRPREKGRNRLPKCAHSDSSSATHHQPDSVPEFRPAMDNFISRPL